MSSWWKGEWSQAVASGERFFELIGLDPEPAVTTYHAEGFRAYVRTIAKSERLRAARTHVSPTWIAGLHAYLGEADRAFEWLERAVREKDGPVVLAFNMNPMFDPVRSDPRFAALADRVGIQLAALDRPLVALPED